MVNDTNMRTLGKVSFLTQLTVLTRDSLVVQDGKEFACRARDLGSYSGSAMQHTVDLKAKQHTLRSSASSSVKQKQSIICKTTLPSSQDFWTL